MSIVQRLLGANPDRDSGEVAAAASAGVVVVAVVALVAYIPHYNIVVSCSFLFLFHYPYILKKHNPYINAT